MCIPKPPPPPAPVAMPQQSTADLAAERSRRALAARQGYSAMIKTGPGGAKNYGRNSQAAGLTGGSATSLGASQ